MFGSIVVGTDGSATAKEAVRQAIDLATQVGASLDIVSAYEPVSGDRLRSEQREAPKDVDWAVNPREDVDHTLEEAARETREAGGSDLIVVGNKGMTGAKRFLLGSVPNKVSHHAPCSVLIIRTT